MSLDSLLQYLQQRPKLLVLTGAGISAASGIPTYRDKAGNWLAANPIQHQEYINDFKKRQRYWARSTIGWPSIANSKPTRTHLALMELEKLGLMSMLVTQNVDRLHQRAGHNQVIDLHGRLDRVICLNCNQVEPRADLQVRLLRQNPHLQNYVTNLAPDGDAFVEDKYVSEVTPPDCLNCGHFLMPDVVFFGGTVNKQKVELASQALLNADALLAVGSSLMVYSGFRFCKMAAQMQKPVFIINQGKTRADELATLKIEQDCHQATQSLLAGYSEFLSTSNSSNNS